MGGLESAYFTHTAIELNDEESDDSINKFNLLFNFILRSCPNLKRIKLEDAFVNARGVINLDYRNNQFLQDVELDFPLWRYYTFHHEPGKFWRNINDRFMQDNFTRKDEDRLRLCVNLAWDITKNIKMKLTGCEL